MKQFFIFISFIFCSIFLTNTHAYAQTRPARHVVLISIDGLRNDMYLDACWPDPNLRQLMKEGTYADHMKSVFPSYTYPSHTAMLTGALPARSGIYYNVKNDKGEWNWFTSAIKTPTLWQALKKNNLTSAAIEWPVSVDPNIDFNIPEIWNPKNPADRISESRKYATPNLIEEVEKYATGTLDSNTMNEEYLSLDENSARAAGYIFQKYKPNFLAVHFACVDGAEHAFGRDGDSVRLALASADRAVGDVLEAIEKSGLKDSTTVIIVGDHGFATITEIFRPNILLKNIPAKFTAAGGSAFMYTKIKNIAWITQEVRQKLDSLPADKRKLFRVIYRDELDRMGADSGAVLALAAQPGLVFSAGLTSLFSPATGGHHGYDPNMPEMYTGFIAAGAGIQKSSRINELCVTDIAPLIAALLALDFKSPDGKLPAGVLSK